MKKRKIQKRKIHRKPKVKELKLDLGCGKGKKEGFIGVDIRKFEGVDKVADLRKRWPWKTGSVDEVHCSHFMEHLTAKERVHFANELFRVLKWDAKATIIVPSWTSERAYGDPTHMWPPVVGFHFCYWSKQWRDGNAPHTGFNCDFDFAGGNQLNPPWHLKTQEVQLFAQTHYMNVATDMFVTVVKATRKKEKKVRKRK